MVALSSCGGNGAATFDSPQQQESLEVPEDSDIPDPLNIVPVPATGSTEKRSTQSLPGDGSQAHLQGQFGPLVAWPTMPIAMAVLPDGRVLTYGSDETGKQNAKIYYVVWDPSIGTGADSFLKLANTTETDIFCTGQALIPETGGVMIFGGDLTVKGKRNYAKNDINVFDPLTSTLAPPKDSAGNTLPGMNFNRWYSSAVTLPNGEHLALGGRNEMGRTDTVPATEATYSPTPEVRLADGTWKSLSTATSDVAYGASNRSWFYPRAWPNPKGGVFIVTNNGEMFNLDTSGTGALTQSPTKVTVSGPNMASVMFSPGRILSIRRRQIAIVMDISSGTPVVSSAGTLAKDRQYGNVTVLADGRVWANGGSSTGNDLEGMALDSELWDPATNTWTTAASATQARLYHSASILLPDGRVLTGGGGASGPETHLDGEIYYPPYLFKKDGSGQFADRPTITDAPATVIGWDQEFSVSATEDIARVTLVRAGVTTHAFNGEARFIDLGATVPGKTVTLRTPISAEVAPPGFYLLFVWNAEGVPSVSKMVKVG